RSDLGFETATLFVRGPEGWELLHRQGFQQPWHGVFDPGVLEGTPEAAEYPDVRSIPGIGSRLARLGCASMAVLPVPDGGRLLLDSHKPCRAGGWIERARPYLELLSMLAGPDWAGQGSLQSQQEVAALDRLFSACQDILARSTARAAVDARRQAVSSLLDRERARMAYALHDGLTQTVTGAVLQLDALAKRIQADPAGALAILETAKTEIRRSLAELRGMLF